MSEGTESLCERKTEDFAFHFMSTKKTFMVETCLEQHRGRTSESPQTTAAIEPQRTYCYREGLQLQCRSPFSEKYSNTVGFCHHSTVFLLVPARSAHLQRFCVGLERPKETKNMHEIATLPDSVQHTHLFACCPPAAY